MSLQNTSSSKILSLPRNRNSDKKFPKLCRFCCCLCCCHELRRSSVVPFTSLWSESTVKLLIEPGRVINVLYLKNKKLNNASPSLLETEPTSKPAGNSPASNGLRVDERRRVSGAFATDTSDEESNTSKTLGKTFIVKVDMERPQTNDSMLSHSSRLSLPPLSTPPIWTEKTEPQQNVGLSYKKVRWKRRKKLRSSFTNSQTGKILSEKLKEMDKIERFPSVPGCDPDEPVSEEKSRLATPLFKKRPRSAKSTFGEIWHVGATKSDIRNRTIFFVHGIGGCFQTWKHQIRCLSDYGYEVVAFDMVGHGKSSVFRKSQDYSFEKLQEDFTAVFDRFAKESNVIVAHSYGTCFAVVVARSRPDRVSHLVLINSGAPIPLSPEKMPLTYVPDLAFRCLAPIIRRNFTRHAFCTAPSQQDFNLSFGTDLAVVKKILDGQNWPDGDFTYHNQVHAQTLLIYGCEDGFVTLDEMQHMRRAIPDSHLEVIENASHMVMLESPEQVNQLIMNFVQLPVHLIDNDDHQSSPAQRRKSVRPLSSLSRILPHPKLLSL